MQAKTVLESSEEGSFSYLSVLSATQFKHLHPLALSLLASITTPTLVTTFCRFDCVEKSLKMTLIETKWSFNNVIVVR